MASVYFDSSVFLAILAGQPEGSDVRLLLRELKKGKIRIITSIITIQEVSVASYRKGTAAKDHHAAVNKLARIEGVDRDIALTSAKFEAQILDGAKRATKSETEMDNKRRKWDCFHIATAVLKKCDVLYSLDDGMLKKKERFAIPGIAFLEPKPDGLFLSFEVGNKTTETAAKKQKSTEDSSESGGASAEEAAL